MLFGYRLKPNRLPNAGNTCVPNAVRLIALFANASEAVVGRIPYSNINLLAAALKIRSYVERESCITALVTANLDTVDVDFTTPVYCTEVKQYVATFPTLRQCKGSMVPQVVLAANGFLHAREA